MKMFSKLFISATLLISASYAEFTPKIDATEVQGTKIYLLPQDGKANEDGSIDQFWLVELINKGEIPKGIHLVDIRKAEKYNAEHIEGAISIPADEDKIDTSKLPKDGVIVFHCNTGLKSIDVRTSMEDENLLQRIFTLDATYQCDKNDKNCKLTPNEVIE